jgi:hypothetical protein
VTDFGRLSFTLSFALNSVRKEFIMSISNLQLERQLFASDAGQAVYDALIQANVDLRTVSLELVKDMLQAEYIHRRLMGYSQQRGAL